LGAGGAAMREAGVEVVVETTDLSFIGVLGSLRLLRRLIGRFRHAQRIIAAAHPDLAVLVDAETVNLPAAIWFRRKRVPVVFFFPPQVWFWGRWRLPAIVPLARRVLSAFRDEAVLFSAAGADTVWIGHPLRDLTHVTEDPEEALRSIGLDPSRPLIALMPGSRRNEIRALASPMLGAARLLKQRDPALQFALPLASEALRDDVERAVRESGVQDVAIYHHPKSYAVLSQARLVLQCSGTATLEAALLGLPAVIVYRCHPVEYVVARHLLLAVPFIGMPNILLGEMVQPEFFHRNVDAAHLSEEAWSLLSDPRRLHAIQSRLATLRELLGPPGVVPRAAEAVLDLLPQAALASSRVAVASSNRAASLPHGRTVPVPGEPAGALPGQ
ncbi:MAG TPA: lipid-A-disaccharide synthase, partial [Albitalea sp.]|nr:lipid-A-disaccharide synthase [Albitalea sp.]